MSETAALYNGTAWDRTILLSLRFTGRDFDAYRAQSILESELPDPESMRCVRLAEKREGEQYLSQIALFPLEALGSSRLTAFPLLCVSALKARDLRLCFASLYPERCALVEQKEGLLSAPEWIQGTELEVRLEAWWAGYRGKRVILAPRAVQANLPPSLFPSAFVPLETVFGEAVERRLAERFASFEGAIMPPPFKGGSPRRAALAVFAAVMVAVNLALPLVLAPRISPPGSPEGKAHPEPSAALALRDAPPGAFTSLRSLSASGLKLLSFTWTGGVWNASLKGSDAALSAEAARAVEGAALRSVRSDSGGTVRVELVSGAGR